MLLTIIDCRFSVCSALAVQSKFGSFNTKIKEKAGEFFEAVPMFKKIDIDIFSAGFATDLSENAGSGYSRARKSCTVAENWS